MKKNCRRIITGFNQKGESVILSDSLVNNMMEKRSRPGVSLNNIWHSKTFPQDITYPFHDIDDEFVMFPGESETICRISSFEPEISQKEIEFDSKKYFSDLGAEETLLEQSRHPFMHKSKTLDYAIILEGEITLLLDKEEILLNVGDIVVQRGTSHAWVNNSDKLCRVCFILMGAKDS
tara:strand:- start:10484 stop:11017 length:534 start_codon:yes stop_codon:yes gene_type:complete